MARCITKKVAYTNVADAMRALEEAKRTWRYPPERWYLCPHCGLYHITAQPKGKREVGERKRLDDLRKASPFATLAEKRYNPNLKQGGSK